MMPISTSSDHADTQVNQESIKKQIAQDPIVAELLKDILDMQFPHTLPELYMFIVRIDTNYYFEEHRELFLDYLISQKVDERLLMFAARYRAQDYLIRLFNTFRSHPKYSNFHQNAVIKNRQKPFMRTLSRLAQHMLQALVKCSKWLGAPLVLFFGVVAAINGLAFIPVLFFSAKVVLVASAILATFNLASTESKYRHAEKRIYDACDFIALLSEHGHNNLIAAIAENNLQVALNFAINLNLFSDSPKYALIALDVLKHLNSDQNEISTDMQGLLVAIGRYLANKDDVAKSDAFTGLLKRIVHSDRDAAHTLQQVLDLYMQSRDLSKQDLGLLIRIAQSANKTENVQVLQTYLPKARDLEADSKMAVELNTSEQEQLNAPSVEPKGNSWFTCWGSNRSAAPSLSSMAGSTPSAEETPDNSKSWFPCLGT